MNLALKLMLIMSLPKFEAKKVRTSEIVDHEATLRYRCCMVSQTQQLHDCSFTSAL